MSDLVGLLVGQREPATVYKPVRERTNMGVCFYIKTLTQQQRLNELTG